MKKILVKKKVCVNYFDEQQKPWMFFKIFQKKNNKNFKAICVVLGYSKPKIFFVGQPWLPTFFQTLPPPPLPPNYFSAATAYSPTRSRVLPVTTSFFWKMCSSFRTSLKEFDVPTTQIPILVFFVNAGI